MQYKVTPTAEFVSAMNKFVRDNPPAPSLSATVIWERVILDDQPDDQSEESQDLDEQGNRQ